MLHMPTLLAAAAVLMIPAAAMAQPQQGGMPMMHGGMPMMPATGPILNLTVSESVESAPDMATINTGVQTRALAARDAMAQNAAQMEKLIAALAKAGIERKDIQTSGINLNPQYDYSNRTDGQGPRFVGYEASNQLTVKVRKLDKAGELVDALVAAGATNINGPSFGIAEPDKLLDQARVKALKTAQDRANLYAQATGFKSARLIGVSEGGGYSPPMPVMMAARAEMAAAPQTKIEPGQISTSISLSVQFMLDR
ncbi:MAG: SIMPL domain-containing protein [Sphingomonadales bacterium]|nr:SIMPL domain-containing protein [Sphingomonadales bacterium]